MIEKGNQTDNFDIIFKYLSEVANQLEKCLCTSQNKCKKRLIGIKPYDENWEPGNDYCHIVIPHRGVKPVVLYSDLQSVDEGFFLVNLIIKQFEMMILANENQPIGNKYGFYSDYNNSLKPEEAARYIYDVATEIVSGILKDTIGVAFNDIDLCMKVRKYGVKIVFTPYAELYHYESKSRGMEDTPEKQLRFSREVNCFRRKWERELLKGDPYYNPNLTLNNTDCSLRKQEKNGD